MSVSVYANILQAIKENVEASQYYYQAQAGIGGKGAAGMVHDYIRWANTEADVFALYRGHTDLTWYTLTGIHQLHAWIISRAGTEEKPGSSGKVEREYDFRLDAYMAQDDDKASEKFFQGKLEWVCQRARRFTKLQTTGHHVNTFPNGVTGVIFAFPLEIRNVETVQAPFGIICHHAELHWRVLESVSRTPLT